MDNSTSAFMYNLNMKLNEDERIVKLSNAVLGRDNILTITFIVRSHDYDTILTDDLKAKIEGITLDFLPKSFEIKIVYKKTITDESYISQSVMDFFYEQSPLIFRKLDDCRITSDIGYDIVKVLIAVPPYIYSFINANDYGAKLTEFLDARIMEQIEIEFELDNNARKEERFVKRKPQDTSSYRLKVVEVANVKNLLGVNGEVTRMPKYISEVNKAESEKETICGKISDFTVRTAKATGKKFFTMKLDDTTATMEAVFFPRSEKTADAFEHLVKDDMTVCIEGQVRQNKFAHNSYSLQIRRLSTCDINYASINNQIEYLKEPEDYYTVLPQKYVEQTQISMFEEPLPEDVINTDFVVFDLETTGLTPNSDKIIEIGAVKISGGHIVQSFSTLINPEKHIPERVSEINHIFDEDVAGAPKLKDVIGDFYKFTRNAVLVGHNAKDFDCLFLTYWGKQCRYNFDNEVADTLLIARDKLTMSNYKLGTLCEKLGIDLTNAHRAWHDAEATAKLFLKLKRL